MNAGGSVEFNYGGSGPTEPLRSRRRGACTRDVMQGEAEERRKIQSGRLRGVVADVAVVA